MGDKDLYKFFEAIGPVQYAIVLSKKYENCKMSRYGFVTFVSQETAKLALAASTPQLTLGEPWKGWSLSVGRAVQRKFGHHYHPQPHSHQHQHPQQEQETRPRVWNRSREVAQGGQGETKPVPVVKVGPASKLRVDAEAWKGRSAGQQQPGELEAQLYHQHQQALNLHFQQQQQMLLYQAELQYNMMTQQGYFPVPQFPETNTTTDQLMILPPTFYHPSGGVVWPQYPQHPQLYPGPTFPQYEPQYDQHHHQIQPQEFGQQYLQQWEQMQDSGFHDVTNASIITVDPSQPVTYENQEIQVSPVLNPSQEEAKRVGPYKRFKTFSAENPLQIRGVKKDSNKGEKGGRAAAKPVKDGITAGEREPTTTTITAVTNKGKEMKKGIKKRVVHALPEAEALPEPFKQLSIK